ncbi:TAXI family TRAP transporter solute-binding subunit [Halomonas sp. TRM85114]|uniref:TAXI family TRAP transporter solute-binding subunit n=1 Tax=Halomonas jincaotanensis TaxID=2810616 RepID=UPI001BD5B04D|nr:TAXI family TRAP transporter solute-binding subunit [Halomonas jincaotanensis]MBS9405139.1 TAXI family TRAP transporter solute-binding subunit [Halomonas jincaotanensis]
MCQLSSISGRTSRALLCALLLPFSAAASDDEEVTIATASPAGVYHIVGRAICRTVDFPCRAEPSNGSVANLDNVRHGAVTLALAQSDSQHFAVSGTEAFRDAGPDNELRSVFALHSEPFTLVVRRDAGIHSLDDIPRHAVNIGNPGSGQHGTMQRLMQTRGWRNSDFLLVNELPADQQSLELCHGNIDAMVYTVGHPNASVAQAIRLCNAALIDVAGEAVDRLVEETPYFSRAWIAGGLYGPDQPAVRTFGVRATLVTSARADPDMIYRLVAGVFENLLRFKAVHPALGMLSTQEMIHEGLSAPLHEGALRYYREKGWLPETGMAQGPARGKKRLARLVRDAGN